MFLHLERGFGCALLLSMAIQLLGCCFDGFVLRLRLLVASVPGLPAGSRDEACLTLDQVVCCSSTSGAEFMFWRPGTLLVPSSLYSPATGKPLGLPRFFSRLWLRFSSSHCWSLLHWRHLSMVRPPSVGDRYLSGLRAGNCGLPLRRRIHARVWLVTCLPLLLEWRTLFPVNPGLF